MQPILGNQITLRVQAATDRPADKANPAADKIPYAIGGHSQAFPEGWAGEGGQVCRDGFPCYDCCA